MKNIMQKNKEIWKDIYGYEGLYQVSNSGRVRSLNKLIDDYRGKEVRLIKGKVLKPFDRNGYYVISLTKNKQRHNYSVHRLVAQAFIKNIDNKPYINHLDYDKHNNCVDNLEWCTQKENINWSIINMKKMKNVTHSCTGEKYISYRAKTGKYRITIAKKEYLGKNTLEEAIAYRDMILSEI